MNDFYSDEQLEAFFGKRSPGIALFEPLELGWNCPTGETHDLTWSEFNDHIWCYDCQKDYFSLLCPKHENVFTSKSIVKAETEKMDELIGQWTLEKYKNVMDEK